MAAADTLAAKVEDGQNTSSGDPELLNAFAADQNGEQSIDESVCSRRSSRRRSRGSRRSRSHRHSRRSSRSRRRSRSSRGGRRRDRGERSGKTHLKTSHKTRRNQDTIELDHMPKDDKLSDVEAQLKADQSEEEKKSCCKTCNFGMWGALTALVIVVVLGLTLMGGDGLGITDDLLDCFDINDDDAMDYNAWISALKEKIDDDNYCLELVQACKIASMLLERAKATESDFEVKMSQIYHVWTHVYFFAYTGDKAGISLKKKGDKKMGNRLMELFDEWAAYAPKVKTPWQYKKFILTQDSFSDFAVSGRAAMIEDAEVREQEGSIEYNFFPEEGPDWSETDWKN